MECCNNPKIDDPKIESQLLSHIERLEKIRDDLRLGFVQGDVLGISDVLCEIERLIEDVRD